jgi:hypothetical protein
MAVMKRSMCPASVNGNLQNFSDTTKRPMQKARQDGERGDMLLKGRK